MNIKIRAKKYRIIDLLYIVISCAKGYAICFVVLILFTVGLIPTIRTLILANFSNSIIKAYLF